MGMCWTGVDLQLGDLCTTETSLGDHAADGIHHSLLRLASHLVSVRLAPEAARVAAMAVDEFLVSLARRQHDLVSIDDDNMITSVEVRRVGGLVLAAQLAAQDVGDLGGEATEDEAFGVDDVPGTNDFASLRGVGSHASSAEVEEN